MTKLIWVGIRESDIDFTGDLFDFSITDYGKCTGNNVSYYNGGYHKKCTKKEFIVKQLQNIGLTSDHKVLFYNPSMAYSVLDDFPELSTHLVGLCSSNILDILNDKIQTRIWMSKHVKTPNFSTLHKKECSFNILKDMFNSSKGFIIQEKISSSGTGTYLMTSKSETEILQKLEENNQYLVSEFISPSASVNSHIFITNEDTIVFPGSLQLISQRNNNFIYSGADFLAYRNIDSSYIHAVYYYSRKIGNLLENAGFRGICGIDFVVSDGEVYFIEINPRFQASTVLLNLALEKAGLPSIHHLQLGDYDSDKVDKDSLERIQVNYSYYKYANGLYDSIEKYNHHFELFEKSEETFKILLDGYDMQNTYKNQYAFGVIFSTNISSFSDDNLMHIHPNLEIDNFTSLFLPLDKSIEKMIALKIALLNQGLYIDEIACQKFLELGGYNESVFSSIDLTINGVRFNVPVNTKLSSISPFSLSFEDGFLLKHFKQKISMVDVETTKSIKQLHTTNNELYSQIAFISGDRLRIRPEKRCYYKSIGKGCSFCPGNNSSNNIYLNYNTSDICEVINYCLSHENFRHILVGGGTSCPEDDFKRMLETISYISSQSDKPIYLMCTPPKCKDKIKEFVEAGVSEIAFNVELFDRNLAKQYMPGKGQITLQQYLDSLSYAVSLLGNKGNVRSMLMVGLEKSENTLKAVKTLCENGVQPMLSIFRPTPNCTLSHIIQPSNKEILSLYFEAQKICKSYNLTLGPSCPSCQNNTLAITIE